MLLSRLLLLALTFFSYSRIKADRYYPNRIAALKLLSERNLSLNEAEEEALQQESYATHGKNCLRICPENLREEGRSDIAISETTQKLKGIQTLTPAEQEGAPAELMKALQDSRRMLGRQLGSGLAQMIGELDAEQRLQTITKENTEQPLTSSKLLYAFLIMKIDHSDAVLASFNPNVPPVVDKYVGTKLDDALVKALERHTADLVEKYSMLPTPEEKEEKKQEPTYTIKLTDKAALEEFDLKSALFKFMHKNKSANRNPANYRLYHALMEALIEDENAMDKEVADMFRDNKRKHDGVDDDDDENEGPPAGSNQGKSTKKRRKKEFESAKKPSTTKESSMGKDPKVGSKTGKSAPAKDPIEEPTDKVIMDEQPTEDIPIFYEGHVSDPEDTDNAHMPKIPDTTTWFKPIPEEERHASPKPEWVIPPIDLPEASQLFISILHIELSLSRKYLTMCFSL
ncbi:hypothetical protein Tco_0000650 [Tanacetum coccineum]